MPFQIPFWWSDDAGVAGAKRLPHYEMILGNDVTWDKQNSRAKTTERNGNWKGMEWCGLISWDLFTFKFFNWMMSRGSLWSWCCQKGGWVCNFFQVPRVMERQNGNKKVRPSSQSTFGILFHFFTECVIAKSCQTNKIFRNMATLLGYQCLWSFKLLKII